MSGPEKQTPHLYPMMADSCDFQIGDCVRKFVTEWNVTPFVGVVTHLIPATNKIWVQWPTENTSESPETLIKVNPAIYGMPVVKTDCGYDSWEKTLSEKMYGQIPKRMTASDKMAIRIAHTFASNVIDRLSNEISIHYKSGLTDVQAYNRTFEKFGSICSDHIIRATIESFYKKN